RKGRPRVLSDGAKCVFNWEVRQDGAALQVVDRRLYEQRIATRVAENLTRYLRWQTLGRKPFPYVLDSEWVDDNRANALGSRGPDSAGLASPVIRNRCDDRQPLRQQFFKVEESPEIGICQPFSP